MGQGLSLAIKEVTDKEDSSVETYKDMPDHRIGLGLEVGCHMDRMRSGANWRLGWSTR